MPAESAPRTSPSSGNRPIAFFEKSFLAVHRDLEHAAASGDQLTVDGEDLLQLGRQTGGSRLVISLCAVLDLDFHDGSSARHRSKTRHRTDGTIRPCRLFDSSERPAPSPGRSISLEHDGFRMLVDCGLVPRAQGAAASELERASVRSGEPRPGSADARASGPQRLSAGPLSQADTPGRFSPRPASRDLCGILLPDSGHLQEEDARYATKRGSSKHKPALPLYTEADARSVLAAHPNVAL